MTTREDEFWNRLLAQSAPAFAPEAEPPLGLSTRVLARLREERQAQATFDRLGLRAILAALAVVVVTAGLTLGAPDRGEVDPGVRSLVAVANTPVF